MRQRNAQRRKIRRRKPLNLGDRVEGVDENALLGCYGQQGTIVALRRHKFDSDKDRYQIRFDDASDPRHAYWFDRPEIEKI